MLFTSYLRFVPVAISSADCASDVCNVKSCFRTPLDRQVLSTERVPAAHRGQVDGKGLTVSEHQNEYSRLVAMASRNNAFLKMSG